MLANNSIPAGAQPQAMPSAGVAQSGEAFVPSYVYEAMKENKRFDTMRVSDVLGRAGDHCSQRTQ